MALAVAAGAWAVVGSLTFLPELSSNSDEGIYLLQADTLRSGRLAPVAPTSESDAFVPWFSKVVDQHYALKYTPVHAAVIAAGEATTRSPRTALAVIAAAQVAALAALAREVGLARRTAAAACALFAFSPLSLMLSTTFLPYGTSVALGLGAAALALRALRTLSRSTACGAGVLIGLAVFARPFDAVLWILAIGVACVRGDRRSRIVGLLPSVLAGAAAPLLALLWFDHAVTGNALQLPFNLIEPLDRPGFGARKALPTDPTLDYTVTRALQALGRNLLLVVAWSGGGLVAAFFGIRALLRRQLQRGMVVSLLVIWPLGYLLFWGSYLMSFLWDGALAFGPYYYLPMVAIIAIPAGVGLIDLIDRQQSLGALAVAGMVVLSGAILVPALAEHAGRSQNREAVASAIDDLGPGPTVVFVPPLFGDYLQNPLSFLRNTPNLDGSVVYALERGPDADARVRAMFPRRQAYRLEFPNGWADDSGFDLGVRLVEVN